MTRHDTVALFILCWLGFGSVATATLVDGAVDASIDNALNRIDLPGSAANGLLYYELSLTFGDTQAEAIAEANAALPGFTFAAATQTQFAAFFEAAGGGTAVVSAAEAGFDTGSFTFVMSDFATITTAVNSIAAADPGVSPFFLELFTDPDGSDATTTTRDAVTIAPLDGDFSVVQSTSDAAVGRGHLLVATPSVAAVPEASGFLGMSIVSFLLARRTRRR